MSLTYLTGDNVLTGALPSGANTSAPILLANGNGTFVFGAHATAQSGTSPTLDVKIQESDDAVTFTDLSTIALTQITGAQVPIARFGFGHSAKKYIRVVGTVGGSATPTITATVSVLGFGAV